MQSASNIRHNRYYKVVLRCRVIASCEIEMDRLEDQISPVLSCQYLDCSFFEFQSRKRVREDAPRFDRDVMTERRSKGAHITHSSTVCRHVLHHGGTHFF